MAAALHSTTLEDPVVNATTQIDLLRHGEPAGGTKYRGQRDDPLTERGWRQMRQATGETVPWDVIVSSPLRRCQAFAQALADERDLPLNIDERLKEVGFGSWEGLTKDEIEARTPGSVANFYCDPLRNRPDGAEPLEMFRDRVLSGWEALLERHAGRRVLLVTHAGVIRMVVGDLLAAPLERVYRIHVPYAGVTRITVSGNGASARAQLLFHAGSLHADDHSADERAHKQSV